MSNSPRKFVTFEIEESTLEVWRLMSLSESEQKKRIEELDAILDDAYKKFVIKQHLEYDQMQQNLSKAITSFERTKRSFGDFKTLPPAVKDQPLLTQTQAYHEATKSIETANTTRIQKIQETFKKITTLFIELGIREADRGEFAKLDPDDMSLGRLGKLEQKLASLEDEYRRRVEVNNTMKSRYRNLIAETGEEIPADVQSLLDSQRVTGEAMDFLGRSCDDLRMLRDTREWRITKMTERIDDLYKLMAIDKSDRMTFSRTPTAESVDQLEKEIEFMESQKSLRMPQVIDIYKSETMKLCDELGLPSYERPVYRGDDQEEAVSFYVKSIQELNHQAEFRKRSMSQSAGGATVDDWRSETRNRSRPEFGTSLKADGERTEAMSFNSDLFGSPKGDAKSQGGPRSQASTRSKSGAVSQGGTYGRSTRRSERGESSFGGGERSSTYSRLKSYMARSAAEPVDTDRLNQHEIMLQSRDPFLSRV